MNVDMSTWPQLTGQVRLEGEALPDALVTVVDFPRRDTRINARTDDEGRFVVQAPPGSWTVTVTANEHLLWHRSGFRFAQDESLDVDIELPAN
jgi:hypothetical protein